MSSKWWKTNQRRASRLPQDETLYLAQLTGFLEEAATRLGADVLPVTPEGFPSMRVRSPNGRNLAAVEICYTMTDERDVGAWAAITTPNPQLLPLDSATLATCLWTKPVFPPAIHVAPKRRANLLTSLLTSAKPNVTSGDADFDEVFDIKCDTADAIALKLLQPIVRVAMLKLADILPQLAVTEVGVQVLTRSHVISDEKLRHLVEVISEIAAIVDK